jgi:hypothetical protein
MRSGELKNSPESARLAVIDLRYGRGNGLTRVFAETIIVSHISSQVSTHEARSTMAFAAG